MATAPQYQQNSQNSKDLCKSTFVVKTFPEAVQEPVTLMFQWLTDQSFPKGSQIVIGWFVVVTLNAASQSKPNIFSSIQNLMAKHGVPDIYFLRVSKFEFSHNWTLRWFFIASENKWPLRLKMGGVECHIAESFASPSLLYAHVKLSLICQVSLLRTIFDVHLQNAGPSLYLASYLKDVNYSDLEKKKMKFKKCKFHFWCTAINPTFQVNC